MTASAYEAAAAEEVLEHGSITFLSRPRVETRSPDDLDDVQRLLILLSPAGSAFERLIAVGRKRFPRQDRFWGFVDLVLTPEDMQAALGDQVYGTRHLRAARSFASGTYEVETHGPHAHLRWHVDRDDPAAIEIPFEHDADYVLTIANPDPAAWGLLAPPDLQSALFDDLELHVTVPAPFSPALQARFAHRKYVQVDTVEWLDHPGAEVVFVGAGEQRLFPR